MFILSKDGTTIVNTENMTGLFIGFEGNTIRAESVGGNKYKLGSYVSLELAKAALNEVARAMYTGSNLTAMISDGEAEARLGKEERLYHVTGKKAKRHGGS